MEKLNINKKPGQERTVPEQVKPPVTPKPQIESLPSLSKRGESNVAGLSWKLSSHKDDIYRRYGISGKEVDKFVENFKKHDTNRGGFLNPSESSKLEKELTARGDTKDRKWLKILSDPKIFK